MSKTSRIKNQNRVLRVPKHLLIFRKETSPYNRTDAKNITSSKIMNELKLKPRSSLKRGKTLAENNYEDDIACLITVERNFVKELINSPIKYKSKSPIPTKKINNSSPIKAQQTNSNFESLTICDFLCLTGRGKFNGIRRNKSSITPDPFIKRK